MITLSPPIDETERRLVSGLKNSKTLIGVIICPSLSRVVNDDGTKTQKRALALRRVQKRVPPPACIIKFRV
jgi:hypothetical protein